MVAAALILICAAWGANAEIYRWKDAFGRVHYSDSKPEDQAADDISEDIANRANTFSSFVTTQQTQLDNTVWGDLIPGDPNKTELFLLTFAGDASQGVFMRESLFIQDLFKRRYQTRGHSIALINHESTTGQYMVASDDNLRKALKTIGNLMDDDDILYLYLTSHGSKDHKLYVNFKPHTVRDFGPGEIRDMLDEAGIRWRVIVVSACYSGGFIPPLKNPYTMIATASQADRTSFGCADNRNFTYYGDAVFNNLMSSGAGIVESLKQAPEVVRRMEDDIGITNHSNPQIWQGSKIRYKLAEIEN